VEFHVFRNFNLLRAFKAKLKFHFEYKGFERKYLMNQTTDTKQLCHSKECHQLEKLEVVG